MSNMTYIWLAIFVLTLIIEIAAPAIVSIWFSAGSLASLILSVFVGDKLIWLQILLFVIVTALTIFLLRPIIISKKELKTTNVDALIGKIGTCLTKIEKYYNGTVKLNGLVWSAELAENVNEPILEGSLVEVVEIQGNKLKIKQYMEEK